MDCVVHYSNILAVNTDRKIVSSDLMIAIFGIWDEFCASRGFSEDKTIRPHHHYF